MIAENEQNPKTKLIQQLDFQLSKCNLLRRSFPEGNRTLFKAVSDWLYYTPKYSDQIVARLINQLKRRIENNTLPLKLKHQFENRSLIKDYQQNPDLNGFLKVHFGLISLTFDRKIIIYHVQDNYLSTITVNNSSNKRAPIVLCRVHNNYAAVISVEVSNIIEMVRTRLCEKLMSHSFCISNTKTNEQIVSKLFQTPTKRMHKKSLSLCDDLQYQGIFNTPSNFAFPNIIHSTKYISADNHNHDDDDLALIGMCNINGYVQYPNQKPLFYGFSPQINRAQSMRIVSMNGSNRKDNYEMNGIQRHSGRLKFFDENKNYGFIVMDEDNSDIFVHYDDLSKAGMTKEYMRTTKHGQIIRFEFSSMSYIGKYDKSRKAVELTHVDIQEFPF